MDFKRYLGKIQNKTKEEDPDIVEEVKSDVVEEVKSDVVEEDNLDTKKTLDFVDKNKNPYDYLKRYLKESKYRDWFNRNYPNNTIYDAVGLSISDYLSTKRELFPEAEISQNDELDEDKNSNIDFQPAQHETKTSFDEFIDERILVSHNAFGNKEMKIKILEVSDESAPLASKFGDRVKLNKIIVTIKHLENQQIEEREFDIESIEKELAEKRHYTSTNRWVPVNDIKNGYVTNARHTTLISDAAALDYIVF